MKLTNLRLLSVLFVFALSASSLFAQTDYSQPQWAKYGGTAEERETNFKAFSFFNEEYTAKNYPMATEHLKHLLNTIPAVSQNIYIRGTSMYKNLLAKATDATQREVYLDSLMILHDLRIEHFGADAKRGTDYILGEKVKDHIKYNAKNTPIVIDMVHTAIEQSGANVKAEILPMYFSYLVTLYSNDMLETETILSEYELVAAAIEGSNDPDKEEHLDNVGKLFISSGAASCENLEAIYKPQYEANPSDKELIVKMVSQLQRIGCNSDFQLQLAEKHYELEPTSQSAARLAAAFEGKKDLEKAIMYYQKAIDGETDNAAKVALALSAAGVSLVNSNASDAIKFARLAIGVNAESGLAWYMLAQAQAQAANCSDSFKKQAAFWVIVDNLQKAKSLIDESQVDNVQKAINSYSANFPVPEEILFRDLTPGDSYTVSCGAVSGTTRVRARQ